MAKEELVEFLKKAEKDPVLQKKLKNLPEDKEKAISEGIAIAKEEGFTITRADYSAFEKEQEELSEEELDGVAGGGDCFVHDICMKKD
jgi:predicted ribosomally synthesized peptide with nif11-like leader